MCKHWNITRYNLKRRINAGWTLEQALTVPVQSRELPETYKDHLGNVFESKTQMCKHWNISYSVFNTRMQKYGWSLEDALTVPAGSKQICRDHLGNTFATRKEMCDYWHVPVTTFKSRRQQKMTLEQALTQSVSTKFICEDHLEQKFANQKEMCRYWNIKPCTFQRRIRSGWALEKALTEPVKTQIIEDHTGRRFENIAQMCRFWHIPQTTFKSRMNNHWTLKKALTTPVQSVTKAKTCTDHLGQEFNSLNEMCAHWDISVATFLRRSSRTDWTLQRVLTSPTKLKPQYFSFQDDTIANLQPITQNFISVYNKQLRMYEIWTVNKLRKYIKTSKQKQKAA